MESILMKRRQLVNWSIEKSSLTNLKVIWPITEELRITTFQLLGIVPIGQDE